MKSPNSVVLGPLCLFPSTVSPAAVGRTLLMHWPRDPGEGCFGSRCPSSHWGIARYGFFFGYSAKWLLHFFAYFSRFNVFPELILQISRMEKKYTFVNTYLSSGHRTGNGQFSFQSQRRAIPKNIQAIIQLHSYHMLARKVMLKILQVRLQQYMNQELPDIQKAEV